MSLVIIIHSLDRLSASAIAYVICPYVQHGLWLKGGMPIETDERQRSISPE